MSELQIIETALEQAARRRRLAAALRGLWQGLLFGSLAALIILGAYHLLPLPSWVLLAGSFLPLPCMLAGFVIGGRRKPSLEHVARWVDGEKQLKERLSTAWEMIRRTGSEEWRGLVLSDAAAHAKELDARKLVTLRIPKVARWAVVALLVSATLGFVPEYRSKAYKQKQADKQNIKEVGRQLAELTRRNLRKNPTMLEPTQKALEAVAETGDRLNRVQLTRAEALKDLSNAADKLKDEMKELGKDTDLQRLQQVARSGSGESQTAEGLQKQMEELQKQLGSPNGNPEAMDKLKDQLQKLQQQAKALADKSSGGSPEQKQKLSESLSALSKQMQQMGLQLPQLDEAMNALAANNPDLVLKDLQASLNDLEKMREMAKTLQQLQQQADKLGKDLAEQLKNGQPEAAQSTLQKMASQLQNGKVSEEQLKQIFKDVTKAVPPAGNYGNIAQKLQSAARQLNSGQKGEAAQSLAAAAKELEKLMQQMGQAQQMDAELAALEKASMCVSSGQCWGQCKSPNFNPNGNNKPGSGVGTWANENGQWDGQFNDRWDNSGIVRPDMASKGHTDRGDGTLSDALKPTKVKGQFSPGGQMPSITLKGISIKGVSKLEYQEAAAAAQSDAQSALSQEKVPRAYQGAVKDYFNDLKP